MMQHLTTLDYGVLGVYLAVTLAIGLYLGKNVHGREDLFLAGRRLPWWAIGLSLVATDIGAIDIVGLAGSSYLYGIVLGNFDWIGSVPTMILVGLFFIPIFWRAKIYTIPEYLGRRYNGGVKTIEALIWGVYLACFTGIMLYATAKMLVAVFGWNMDASIVASAVIVGLYTIVGGLAAVVYTDTIQCVVMIVGCLLVLVFGLIDVGGIGGMVDRIHALGTDYRHHFDLVHPVDTKGPYPWPGILLGLALVQAPGYWISNQAVLQRSFGARSEFDVKAAFVWGAMLKILIPFLIVIPGLLALARNPNIADSDLSILHLVAELLPTGLTGLFYAAFLAAFMSSVDSSLNSAATVWSNDLYKQVIRRDASVREELLVGRIITFTCIIFAIIFALWLSRNSAESVFTVFQVAMSLFLGPSLAIIALGMLWPRANGAGALAGLVAGLATSTSLYLTNLFATDPVFQIGDPFVYITMWACIATIVITVGVSLCTPPEPDEKLEGLVYRWKGKNNASDVV